MTHEVIWSAKMDKRYDCIVIRTGEYTGQLSVTDSQTSIVHLTKDVKLFYGAKFGPDQSDVLFWEDVCMEVIDEYLGNY